jgi:hypothetical protein
MRASVQCHCVAMNGEGVMDEWNRRMELGNCFSVGRCYSGSMVILCVAHSVMVYSVLIPGW